jgi:hypothetical protein
MTWEQGFDVANTVALAAWIALVLFPRRPQLTAVLRYGVVGLFAAVYVVLAVLYLPRIEGASFTTLAGLKALLSSEPALLTGWLHYLAFDLFVGLWIAERADARGWSRIAQAPILLATFMLGPLGLLLFYLALGIGRMRTA